MATRFQADRDLVVISESQGSKLDPSTRNGVGAKMGLDATKPLAADEMVFKRIRVPGEEDVDVAALLAGTGRSNWREAVKALTWLGSEAGIPRLCGGCRMRIAVMAAGAVGGYYGGRMAAAGHDVTFIARGAHRDAIRRDGLKIESTLGDLHLEGRQCHR